MKYAGVRSVPVNRRYCTVTFCLLALIAVPAAAQSCGPGDLDGDGDVDLADVAVMQSTFTGPLTCSPTWSSVGGGVTGGIYLIPSISAMTVFDDGGGPALYVAGDFNYAGGVPANFIAKWNGSAWSALGSGFNERVHALTVFDAGTGPALYAGGLFSTAGGVPAVSIAKWNGANWSPLGSGTANHWVRALAVFNDGTGPALYAGGHFTQIGGLTNANHIAKWNGSTWSPLGPGTGDTVLALQAFNGGAGPALYAGGSFTSPANHIARWNGSTWSSLGSYGADNTVTCMTVYDTGCGENLVVGGAFTVVDGLLPGRGVALWTGSAWEGTSSGITGEADSLRVFDDGTGPNLFVGGSFPSAGGYGQQFLARWNGRAWSNLGPGIVLGGQVFALEVFDDGTGPGLYAGGYFCCVNDNEVNRIARWTRNCSP